MTMMRQTGDACRTIDEDTEACDLCGAIARHSMIGEDCLDVCDPCLEACRNPPPFQVGEWVRVICDDGACPVGSLGHVSGVDDDDDGIAYEVTLESGDVIPFDASEIVRAPLCAFARAAILRTGGIGRACADPTPCPAHTREVGADDVTDAQIEALRDEAARAGDLAMVDVARVALRGGVAARARCAEAIRDAAAQGGAL